MDKSEFENQTVMDVVCPEYIKGENKSAINEKENDSRELTDSHMFTVPN